MEELFLNGEPRSELGSRAASAQRQSGRLPANLYGLEGGNIHFTLDTKVFSRFLSEGHRMAELRIGAKVEHGVVKEVQYDGMGSSIVHVDFTRVSRDVAIEVEVPLALAGVPKGVAAGGSLNVTRHEVLVRGLPQDLPESIPLNIETFDLGHVVRIGDMPPIPSCEYADDDDMVVLMVAVPRGGPEEEAAEGGGPVEPEVIGQKKEDDENSD